MSVEVTPGCNGRNQHLRPWSPFPKRLYIRVVFIIASTIAKATSTESSNLSQEVQAMLMHSPTEINLSKISIRTGEAPRTKREDAESALGEKENERGRSVRREANDRMQEGREGNTGKRSARRAERLVRLNKESTVARGVAGSADYWSAVAGVMPWAGNTAHLPADRELRTARLSSTPASRLPPSLSRSHENHGSSSHACS